MRFQTAPLCTIVLSTLIVSAVKNQIWSNHSQHFLVASAAPIEVVETSTFIEQGDGVGNMEEGKRLFDLAQFDEAAAFFWKAVLAYEGSSNKGTLYTLEGCFQSFLQCFSVQGKLIDGFLFVAKESLKGKQIGLAKTYLAQASAINPDHDEVKLLTRILETGVIPTDDDFGQASISASASTPNRATLTPDENRAMELYERGTLFFNQKLFDLAARSLDQSCELGRPNPLFYAACTNAVYCRTNINDWGENGAQFDKDMEMIVDITKKEIVEYMNTDGSWQRPISVNPHMMLAYPVNPKLKRLVSESHAFVDEILARRDLTTGAIKTLPPDLPFGVDSRREAFKEEASNPNSKIRIGFVSAAFSSKAVLYLSHDMFRFFDKDKFEVHIFSAGAADNPQFIEQAMRGVDWRERVKQNADYFHDVQKFKNDHIGLARIIHDLDMHILIEWDGYARQGSRAQGLLALRPAPIQILHQEYLGTYGGDYIDYIITDKVTSPLEVEDLYTEKFMYMPNHFFSKGHAVQAEIAPPSYDYKSVQTPYVFGTGSPQENRCLAPSSIGPEKVSFVYCNFNKFLKNNPDTVRSWIQILRDVPNSMICMLENPKDGVHNLRDFVNDVASLDQHDGADLNSRIQFLPWAANPFDHQMRNRDFCNVMLDSHPYNGHTIAQDGKFKLHNFHTLSYLVHQKYSNTTLALYGGVPIVTRSDGDDMSSLVSTSANSVLDMEDLNARDGISDYIKIATKLGNNSTYFESTRNKLIDTCLQTNPMHPYWDVKRYVNGFQQALESAWLKYLSGERPSHITVVEEMLNGGDGVKEGHSEL